MPLLVVGSVALDCVETPTAKRDDVLGGSAVFFSYSASFFSHVRMIGAVGETSESGFCFITTNNRFVLSTGSMAWYYGWDGSNNPSQHGWGQANFTRTDL